MIEAACIDRNLIDEKEWNNFVDLSTQRSIYAYSWYLDCICESWEAVTLRKSGELLAILPLNRGKKAFVKHSLLPRFSQFLGILHKSDIDQNGRPYEDLKKIQLAIIEAIPEDYKLFDYNFHPSMDYLLPFQWADFEIKPMYTYWLELGAGMEELKSDFSKSVRRDLELAEKHELSCVESKSINELVKFLRKKHHLNSQEESTLYKLWNEIIDRDKGVVLQVLDQNGKIQCAAAFLVDHDRFIYFLCASADKPKCGQNSFLIHSALEKCFELDQIKYFDFEGSMIESVEHYFRGFGPEKQIYFNVRKNKLSVLYNMVREAKNRKTQTA